jgi:Xaa-Pro aminopeptidase
VANRLARVRAALKAHGVDGALWFGLEALPNVHVRYISGFRGSSAVIAVDADAQYLLTDFRYAEQAAAECPGWALVVVRGSMVQAAVDLVRERGWQRVGLEAERVTWRVYDTLAQELPGCTWVPLDGIVDDLRAVKDDEEIAALRRAAELADAALARTLPTIRGRSERAIARALEQAILEAGADAVAFPTIVASGPRGSLPHARPSDRVVAPGDLVTIDFGAVVDGYHSDETVTVAVGWAESWQRDLFELVRSAQAAGLRAVRSGATAKDVDAACRAIIEAAGRGREFGHGAGHGVGLEIHERPLLTSRPDAPPWILEPKTVITVEPGVYLPGRGGVRLEDTVVVTDHGYERLTTWPKEWTVL